MSNDRSEHGRGPGTGPGSPAPNTSTRLFPVLYEELRRLARRQLSGEGPGLTLDPTGLVHEAYVRLKESGSSCWNTRGHFFGAAAMAMRRILIERARRYSRAKHGAGRRRVSLDVKAMGNEVPDSLIDVLALDEALQKLLQLDPRKHEVVMLRFFGGLGIEETAVALDLSVGTVKGDWRLARAWLFREMARE